MHVKLWKTLNILIAASIIYAAVQPYQYLYEQINGYVWFCLIPLVVSAGANYYVLRKSHLSTWYLALPAIFLIGFFTAAASISWPVAKFILSIASGILFYVYEVQFPEKHTIYLEELFTLAAGFSILVGLLAASFYYNLTWWIGSILVFALFLLIFYQQFYKMKRGDGRELLHSSACSLIIFEFFWITLFWPVHFLTSAVIVFAVFYMIHMISNLSLAGELTRRKVYFQTVMMFVLILSGLLSSAWQP